MASTEGRKSRRPKGLLLCNEVLGLAKQLVNKTTWNGSLTQLTFSHLVTKLWNDQEISRILNDSDFEFSDEEDPEFVPSELSEASDNDNDYAEEENVSGESDIPTRVNAESGGCSDDILQTRKDRTYIWKNKRFDKTFIANETCLDKQAVELKTPFEYFQQFFSEEFWSLVSDETNLYSVQSRDGKSVKTTPEEIQKLCGLLIIMGVFKIPQARLYWSQIINIPIVTETMARDRFYCLRNHLHFADNLSPNRDKSVDKLWKVRPVVDRFREGCLQIPRPLKCSIDEQMIPFSGRCAFRQYLPSKPNPLGLKNFILASSDGAVLDFLIYTGKNTVSEADMKEFGVGGGVVKILSQTLISSDLPAHYLFTDRYFTGLNILDELLKHNIYITGTIMANRIGNVAQKLTSDKKMKRGEFDEKVRSDGDACILKWKDNKTVLMLSAAFGSEPKDHCKRWSKEENAKIDVGRPAVIREYNKEMGGVDLCDRFIAYYRNYIKTSKWPVRFFSHFLDMAVSVSWILYKRDAISNGMREKQYMPLFEFRLKVAEALIKKNNNGKKIKRGRPSAENIEVISAQPRKRVKPLPCADARYDETSHFPFNTKEKFQSRCRLEGCTGKSRFICTKCKVHLCLINKNCFLNFHRT